MITEIKGSDLPPEANMMYRCENCGNLFEEGEQAVWEERHGLDTPPYERWSGCPICKGDYDEVRQCKKCGDWHTKSELYDGWCEKCLCETINYDTFFEYCESNKDKNYLDTFVMAEFLDMEMPTHSSFEFHKLMIDIYKERIKEIEETQKTIPSFYAHFPEVCINFIMEDDGTVGREYYAEWLNKNEVSK